MSTESNAPNEFPFPQPVVVPEDARGGAVWAARPPHLKFQHNYAKHLLYFGLTFFTTTFRGPIEYLLVTIGSGTNPFIHFTWPEFVAGLWYSLPLLLILSCHEFGHYFACRYHDVDATLPYYIPAPLPLTGTFGAVIRIKEAFPSKRALFDIGVAGPVAGFIALLPVLYFGVRLSEVTILPPGASAIYFGEPLLWKAFAWMQFGSLPKGVDIALHPMGFAAWWGMLATALNLFPFGQLDGGHVMYAALGRRASTLSLLTLGAVLLLAFRSSSWYLTAAMMVGMAMFFGFRHPRIYDEDQPLDTGRRWVAVLALVIFILCFTPVPISLTPQ